MAGLIARKVIKHRKRGVIRLNAVITTDASGDASLSNLGPAFGRIVGFMYDGGLDASATVTVKDTKTGAALVTYTTGTEGTPVAFRPTTAIVTNAGAAIAAADTAPNINRSIEVAGQVSLLVAGGGNVEHGIVSLIVDEVGLGELALTV